jgi:decaprenylphospho-beta-D-erythro-pentofuranosid-2-ulose 2-reductase
MENAFSQPQSVVVLGGSSDIARAIVKKLAAARTRNVVLAGRNQSLLDVAAKEATDAGVTSTSTAIFDANAPLDAGHVVDTCFEKAGDIVDLVIIAVGHLGDQLVDEKDVAASVNMVNVNFTWPVAALAQIRNRLLEQGSGRILVISSVAAIRVRRSMYLYSGTKAGLDRLCDGLADSLEGTGVSLQILRPGPVRTRMTEGKKEQLFTQDVDNVASDTIKGLSSGKRVITSPPILEYLFAILRHLPAPLWRKINEDR